MTQFKSSTIAEPMVHITRVFDAPRELVFKAWASPDALEQWFAPRGCDLEISEFNFYQGGTFLTCIRNPQFHDCWAKGKYLEIVEPERISFSMGVADGQGNDIEPVSAGMDPEWPQETIVTVTFEEHEGKTTLTLYQTVSEALAKRTGAHPSWLQMLDRLAETLT